MSNYPTGNRTQMSWVDVYKVARQGGFSPAAAVIATAITEPEAGRQPGVQQAGQPYRTTGWGLWQITPGNSVPSVGVDNALLDPLTNARAAYAKYHAAGDRFTPWTTYTSGAYKASLAAASSAAASVGDNIAGAVTSGVGAAAGGIGGTAGGLGGGVGGTSPSDLIKAINQLIGSGGNIAQAQIDTIVGGNLPSGVQAAIAATSGVVSWLGGAVTSLTTLVNGLLWLVNPANWVRIVAAVVGGISLAAGAVIIGKSA